MVYVRVSHLLGDAKWDLALGNRLTFRPLCFREYLTGFHKRKVERRKAAVAEIRKKIKEEQIRVREEVSVKYMCVQSLNL